MSLKQSIATKIVIVLMVVFGAELAKAKVKGFSRHRTRRAIASTSGFDFSGCQNLTDASHPRYQECIQSGCYKPLDIENAGLVCPEQNSAQSTPSVDSAE